ncbi:MAG: 2-amino-4-hydroxy-6-hydroxymethyldihydropteridine diphosphokinase [Candidatus Lambdaproteobacteria bacterium]|nr:2-amino-4-hydroxy-6-hydroxymethyldihydropteridine diphosphokinase [Candidatus Lambdaproteobacteria bacterium]
MARAYIALGSNVAPERHLPEAVRRLGRRMAVTARSRVYRTPPWGYLDQPPFLNAALAVETSLAPLPLLELLLGIERELGRVRTLPNGPRTIDLDLLLYGVGGDLVVATGRLTLPHPRLHERAFVLVPLADVAPDLRHPLLGLTVRELLARVDTAGVEAVDEILTPPLAGAQP